MQGFVAGKVLQFTVRAEGATEAAGRMSLRQPEGAWLRPQAAAKDTTDWEGRRCEGLLKRMADQATAFSSLRRARLEKEQEADLN